MGNRPTTYVSNATDQEIKVKVDAERKYITKAGHKPTVGVKDASTGMQQEVEMEYNKIQSGFALVGPGRSLKFDVEYTTLFRSTAYISIVTSEGRTICDALPRRADQGVIATADGYIADIEDDDKDLWLDTKGINHKPK